MNRSARSFRDPAPEAVWEVWYRDTFDRECPPSVDVQGGGLTRGLMELWARHLFETVRPDGGQGFSRFHLRWKPMQIVEIEGSWPGTTRLRRWMFGTKRHSRRGYVAEANVRLLEMVATTHAHLVLAQRSCAEILAAAEEAASRQDFEERLQSLIGGL